MCVIRNQMIRCSSKLTVSYLTIITKNHVFPTLANFCRNTKWFRCWKLYPKKKDEKTLVKSKESRRVSWHSMDKYLTGQKIWKCRGRASMCLKKQSSFNGWLRRPECLERNRRLWEKPSPKPSSSTPSKLSCAGASCGNNPMKWKQTKCWRYNAWLTNTKERLQGHLIGLWKQSYRMKKMSRFNVCLRNKHGLPAVVHTNIVCKFEEATSHGLMDVPEDQKLCSRRGQNSSQIGIWDT